MPPSIVFHLGHIVVVLRRSPASVTSSSPSSRHRADETLPRPQLDQEFEGRHRAEHVQIAEVPCIRYLIGWIAKMFDYINRVIITFLLSVYEGTYTTLSPLVAMHHLGSCVCIGFFLKLLCSPIVASEPGLCVDVICTSRMSGPQLNATSI